MRITAIDAEEHEEVYRVEDAEAGLKGFIAVHSTRLGPAAGGLRMRVYRCDDEALRDVLNLSRGMTFKNAAADLPLGGGKAVIIGDPSHDKTPAILRAMGRAIGQLEGRYWTAEDMGMTPDDMAVIAAETPFVAGLAGGDFASGDPSPVTALGVFNAVRRATRHRLGYDSLYGLTVSVQGLGNVGRHLAQLVHGDGAHLVVTDIDPARVAAAIAEWGAEAAAEDDIYKTGADIFAPCAIGGVLNAETIPQLRARVVVGAANNQLATPADGDRMAQRGILYAPDFVANGGGIINVAAEILKVADRPSWVASKLTALDATMEAILVAARTEGVSPNAVAERIVAERMSRAAA
ncbi:Leucine dehydrogenase [Defluviimonas aquaemixtae]|uniref:Leucine dehydrogenase n=1 Tax=Albidovulum aquaemixtae TaxID=1542388 RepID=A0A2R8B7P1_9RHOB|nr:Glu/Leu/Phe/Val dehydrogenase dimerization domain-containing protein [Defluviimonas aquaemixtae]SPH18618.1 Leucine dehydrogenase [Defluviimonas aquaemixtae]